jgi:hypothetical protein
MKWKYFLAWLPGVPIAIINGMIREFYFQSFMAELPAHQLSVVSFIFLFGLYVWLIIPWLKLTSAQQALQVGLLWLAITIAFEFIFGHYVMGHSWSGLFNDYNLMAGRLWLVVLFWTSVAPLAMYRLHSRK